MEALLVLLGLAAAAWVLVGPFLYFSHSSRLKSMSEEIQKLRRELGKKTEALTSRINVLTDQQIRKGDLGTGSTETSTDRPLSVEKPKVTPQPEAPRPYVPFDTKPAIPIYRPVTHLASEALTPEITASDLTPIDSHASEFAAAKTDAAPPQPVDESSPWLADSPPAATASSTPRDTAEMLRERLEKRPRKPHVEPSTPPKAAKAFTEMDATKWMSWIGAIAVMVGAGFGLKYAIDEKILGPPGRVGLGILVGMATFVGAAYAMKKNYRELADGLSGASMGILYFSLFAAFQWYDLIPQLVAFGGMIAVTAAGLSFAGKFNSLPSAVLAMIGGFLTPFMLSKGGGNVSLLFTYILILDLGVLALATFRSWGSLHLLNFGGTLLIWVGWLANNYHAEELWLTVAWITLFAVVFSLMGMWRHVIRRETSSTPDMALMLLTPIAYFGALYGLTKPLYSGFHGIMAILVAGYYLLLGVFAFLRNPGNNQIVVTLVGVGLSFVTLAVPLQLTGHWIVIAWAVESLLLIEIGLRYEKPGFRLTGFGLLAIVQFHMVLYAGGTLTGPTEFTTGFVRRMWEDAPVSTEASQSLLGGIINGRSMSFLANAIVLAILAWEYRRREKTARIENSEGVQKIGWAVQMPDAGQVSMILIPLVPVIVLGMGLLETFVFGVRAHWSIATHLSMLPIWLSLFAVATLLSFKRMNDVSTLGALSKCLYGITGCLFLTFILVPFPDWSNGTHSLWGWTLFNPRGFGFLSALGAAIVGAIQFSRSESSATENRSIATSMTLAVPLVLLGMCLTETFAFGRRHDWLWATQLSCGGIWLAVFSVGTLIASRWLQDIGKLGLLSRLFYLVTAGLMALLILTTVGDAAAHGQTMIAEAWSRPLLNPRGICLLVGAISLAIGVMGQSNTGRLGEKLFAKVMTLAVPITLLALCLVETYAFGKRHDWIWASQLSSVGIWLSIFSVGLIVAGRSWVTVQSSFRDLSQVLTLGVCVVIVFLFMGTLLEWPPQIRAALSSAWSYPFLNPRGACFLLAITGLLVNWRLSPAEEDAEPHSGPLPQIDRTQLGLVAYAIMFLMFTIEVFALGKQLDWKTNTSLAITGTWTLLAIATIGAGIMKRSAPVRILALSLFALTTAKVFLYDVWYLAKPTRIAAFIGLGVALFVTSFLYQRFSSRIKDWIKPMSLLLAASLMLGCGHSLRAEEEADLSTHFSHRFEITRTAPGLIGPDFDPDFVRIPLTPEIYDASRRDLADLRLLSVDPSGVSTQIPYILVSPTDQTGQADMNLPITDRQEVGGQNEFIVDARNVTDPIEMLHLAVGANERNYLRTVTLYGADQRNDGDWKLLVNDGFLVDRMRDSQRLTESTIACPRSKFRYYRVVIENDGQPPLSITACLAHMVRRHTAPRVSYTMQIANVVRTDRKITRSELTLAGPVPVDRIEITLSGADEYHRNAQLMAVSDTSTAPITSVALFHLAKLSKGPTTSITFHPQSTKRFRMEIDNGDDQPLTIQAAQAFGVERSLAVPVKLLTANANPIAIYVGGSLGSPSYDLARISNLPDVEKMSTLGVLTGERNAAYREVLPQRAWAEDHRTLVWLFVLGGVLVLSALAIKLLKAASEQQSLDGSVATAPANAQPPE